MKTVAMSNEEIFNMCRVCLSRDLMANIFAFSSKFGCSIVSVITSCAPIQITKGDGLPSFVCQSCCFQLEKIYQFQMLAKKSDKILQQYLKKLNVSTKSDSFTWLLDNRVVENKTNGPSLENIETGDNEKKIKTEAVSLHEDNLSIHDEDIKDEVEEEMIETIDNKTSLFCDKEINKELKIEFNSEQKLESHNNIPVNTKHKLINNRKCKNYHCKSCGTSFNQNSKLKLHKCSENIRITNISESEFRSSKNSVSVKSKKIFMKNKTDKNHQCKSCNAFFVLPSKLKTHKCCLKRGDKHECDICHMRFTYLSVLRLHKRVHTGEKPYRCDDCNKTFARLDSLKSHKRIHTGERQYGCDICGKSFTYLSVLKQHKRQHTGEKPYRCEVCQKNFTQIGSLISHKRLHTGEKPYQCEVCSKLFANMNNLNAHKRTHTGEKVYKCDICDKSFIFWSGLRVHKLKHAGKKPYQCDICGKCFVQSGHLTKHKRSHNRTQNDAEDGPSLAPTTKVSSSSPV